jgi:hypothetical protein
MKASRSHKITGVERPPEADQVRRVQACAVFDLAVLLNLEMPVARRGGEEAKERYLTDIRGIDGKLTPGQQGGVGFVQVVREDGNVAAIAQRCLYRVEIRIRECEAYLSGHHMLPHKRSRIPRGQLNE